MLTELEYFSFQPGGDFDFSPFTRCLKLNKLCLDDVDSNVEKVEGELAKMPWFKSIELSGSINMNLGWASGHETLQELTVTRLGVEDLAPLSSCVSLRRLNVAFNPIRSFAPLQSLQNLRNLDIRGTPIVDFAAILKLDSIVTLYCSANMKTLPGFIECRNAIIDRGGSIRFG